MCLNGQKPFTLPGLSSRALIVLSSLRDVYQSLLITPLTAFNVQRYKTRFALIEYWPFYYCR